MSQTTCYGIHVLLPVFRGRPARRGEMVIGPRLARHALAARWLGELDQVYCPASRRRHPHAVLRGPRTPGLDEGRMRLAVDMGARRGDAERHTDALRRDPGSAAWTRPWTSAAVAPGRTHRSAPAQRVEAAAERTGTRGGGGGRRAARVRLPGAHIALAAHSMDTRPAGRADPASCSRSAARSAAHGLTR